MYGVSKGNTVQHHHIQNDQTYTLDEKHGNIPQKMVTLTLAIHLVKKIVVYIKSSLSNEAKLSRVKITVSQIHTIR